jgi:hypothetical protein
VDYKHYNRILKHKNKWWEHVKSIDENGILERNLNYRPQG